MEDRMKVIGFSDIQNKQELEKLINEILDNPTKKYATGIDDQLILKEYIKDFSENTYVRVSIVLKKSEEEPETKVLQFNPGVQAKNNLEVRDIVVEGEDYTGEYYVFCEHVETAIQFGFLVHNAVEYLQEQAKGKRCISVNVAGLADEGTIILPIEKNEEDEMIAREEREKLKSTLEKMKDGDLEARLSLEEEEKELDNELKQRLREEDFLTIMSGYFIPIGIEEGTYAVLGEIKEIEQRINSKTQEAFYIFSLNINDMPLEVAIDSKTLIGMPSIGMRFMGTCWLQGKVILE